MSKKRPTPEAISDEALDGVNGGILIGLLLPAVQKVSDAPAKPGDGSVRTVASTSAAPGGIKSIAQGTGGNGI
ncbi:MAG: hypothetical protein HEQ22_02900 [Sphingopyxis sp.]|uniref:hypothetical protein n=1 Tax=Sphingopyxis sp. TaxID=1908224 RepID=UPI003D80BC8B